MLLIRDLDAGYGRRNVLHYISLECGDREIVALIGPNGAGKTTLLKTISGLLRGRGGVLWNGDDISRVRADRIVARGISHVPEGRQLFAPLTVRENLQLGGVLDRRRDRRRYESNLDVLFNLFPVLRERLDQSAGSLSGGEQQMLAISRALMNSPSLLMLDEPSLGLAPKVIDDIYGTLLELRERGLSLLLCEATAERVLDLADRIVVIVNGRIVHDSPAREIDLRVDFAELYFRDRSDEGVAPFRS